MRPPVNFGYNDNRLLDATGRPRMDCFQPPDSRQSVREGNLSGFVRPPKPTTRPPPIADESLPRHVEHQPGYQQLLYPSEGRTGYSEGWGRDDGVTQRYEVEQRSVVRPEPMPYREVPVGSGQTWGNQGADYYYYREGRPVEQQEIYPTREQLVPPSTQYYYDPPQPPPQYRQPLFDNYSSTGRGYSERPQPDYPPTAYPLPSSAGAYSSSSPPPPPPPPQQQLLPHSDGGHYGYAVGSDPMMHGADQHTQLDSTIPIRQNLNSEYSSPIRPVSSGAAGPSRDGYGLRIPETRERYAYSRATEEDRPIREKGVLSPPSVPARSPRELPPDFEPEADVPCQADLDSVRHRPLMAQTSPPAVPVLRRTVKDLPEEEKPARGQLGPSRLETIPERPQPREMQKQEEEEEMPLFGLKAPVWPEGYHPPTKKIPSGTVTCLYTWPRMKLGKAVAQFVGFTRQLLPCDGDYSRLPSSGMLWKTRPLEPVGIALISLQASANDKEEDTYVNYWGQKMVVKVAVLKAEKVDKAWVAALEKSRSCHTIADEKVQEMELAIPAHIELVQKGLFKGLDGSQVRGDRTNFPLFNDYLSHLERYGRGGRIKDPFRDSRPTDDRHERYNNSMPSVLVRSDNAAETALFEERARLWDALSKCDIDETITERFSCVLCKNGCQGLGQLVEHVTSKAHTSTAVLFHSRDAVMTLPINGTKDKVVKFDVKDLRHWIESAPGSGEATVAAGGREVVDATTMG